MTDRQRTAQHQRDIGVMMQKDKYLNESRVSDSLMNKVMNRIEGREDGAPGQSPSAQAAELEENIRDIELWGNELMGVVHSIQALVKLYNQKIDEQLVVEGNQLM